MVDETSGGKAAANVRITVGRSPAYPYISLEKALEKADLIRVAGAHRQAMPPETFYHIWKFGALSSGARQTLAALNIFGLVDYIGRGDERKVRLSELAQRIVLDKQEQSPERSAAIKEAALTPAIHAELYEKYGSVLPANVVIQTFLERDKGYNGSAAKALIAEYRDTLTFSGLDKPDSMSSLEAAVPEIDYANYGSAPAPLETRRYMDPHPQGTLAHRYVPQPPPSAVPVEEDVMRGRLSADATYKLYVNGAFGVTEIDTLMRLLKAQRDVLVPPPPPATPTGNPPLDALLPPQGRPDKP